MKNSVALAIMVVLSASGAQWAQAQSTSTPTMRMIEVSGSGEARANPDRASIELAVETHAANAEESAAKNAAIAQKVVQALKAKLADKGKIWTGGYSLFPEYNQPKGTEKPRIIGYRAENSIRLETGALTLIGSLIDTAIAAGSNRVSALNFDLRDDTIARGEAIAKAAKDAESQAQALTKSLGLKLGRVMRASTVGGRPGPVPIMRNVMMARMAAPETPVTPNEITVSATVTVTYAIE